MKIDEWKKKKRVKKLKSSIENDVDEIIKTQQNFGKEEFVDLLKPLYEQEGSSFEDLVDWNQLGE